MKAGAGVAALDVISLQPCLLLNFVLCLQLVVTFGSLFFCDRSILEMTFVSDCCVLIHWVFVVWLLPIRQWAIPSIAGEQPQVLHLHRAQAPQVRPVFQLHPAHRKPHLEMSPGTRKCWKKSQLWKKSMAINTLHGRTKMASSTLQRS